MKMFHNVRDGETGVGEGGKRKAKRFQNVLDYPWTCPHVSWLAKTLRLRSARTRPHNTRTDRLVRASDTRPH